MLSLSNAFDINDMNEFISKVNNFLNSKDKNIEMFLNQRSMEYLQL